MISKTHVDAGAGDAHARAHVYVDGTGTSGTSSGTTSVIRKRLNFTDELLWKQFSSRRLQLVESLSLSSKKASEQDAEINLCATTLMHEFNFPGSTLPEFDKLVRLAIQSVRRNKKRSEKRLASKLETLTSDDDDAPASKKSKRNQRQHQQQQQQQQQQGVSSSDPEEMNHLNNLNTLNNLQTFTNIVLGEEINNIHATIDPDQSSAINPNNHITDCISATSSNANLFQTSLADFSNLDTKESSIDHHDSRVAINTLIKPIIPDSDKLPSLKKLDENPEFTKSAKAILHAIKTSKSCFEFSKNMGGDDCNAARNYDLLEEFGSNCINSSVLYTLEKWFDHLYPDSASYIKLRLKSDLTMGLIVKNLDKSSVEVNSLSNYVAAQLFKKLIGGCVKDFGFDAILNPLCDIFHSIIIKDYPIITKNQATPAHGKSLSRGNSQGMYFTDQTSVIDSTIRKTDPHQYFDNSNRQPHALERKVSFEDNTHYNRLDSSKLSRNTSHYSSNVLSNTAQPPSDFPLSTAHIPIPPPSDSAASLMHSPLILRSKQYSNVIIKFNEKELKFRYCMDSNAPPTILELVSNCKQAFGIINSTRILNLRDVRSGSLLKRDYELERLLRMAAMLSNDGNGEVTLELVYTNSTQGFLNLNYEPPSLQKQQEEQSQEPQEQPKQRLVEQEQKKPQTQMPPPNKTEKSPSPTVHLPNNSTADSLIGRYLPPPRPLRPETTIRRGFMKFQPLL